MALDIVSAATLGDAMCYSDSRGKIGIMEERAADFKYLYQQLL